MKKKAVKSKKRISSAKIRPAAKAAPRRKVVAKKPARAARGVKKTASAKQEILLHDMKAEASKYYTGAPQPVYHQPMMASFEGQELPQRYDEDIIVIQVRDPWWAHAYWDVAETTWNKLRSQNGHELDRGHWVLRAYDISYIHFDGTNAHRMFDTGIDVEARNWYLNLGAPGTSWIIDLGVVLPDGRFILVARSNAISLPLDGPSWVTDEEWMIPEDDFRRLYGMSVGLGPRVSSPVGKLWQERLKKDVTSRGIASMVSSPVKKKEKGAFWLVVDAELVVYGATESDAKVTVQGKPIKLRRDGTFTLRFALPDGKQEIPVVAVSAKINEKRTITPMVTRRTTRNP